MEPVAAERYGRAPQEAAPLWPVLDFYCPAAKLAVEVDGLGHDDGADEKRTAWLATEGIRVLRFTAAEIEDRPAMVVAKIAQAAPPSTA